ncbi:MAG TPA: methyltransferase domain-containing protein [Methanotrichaceae archaeon]|nr:methyltransferase domain-containing protein [Methanotrichaceae archaeon]
MFEEIGTIRNHAETDALQLLALFKDSISEIQLSQSVDSSAYFSPEYSHYIVVHTPLDMEFSGHGKEWTRRFCGGAGVSIVELIEGGGGAIYVKGLMAANESKVYAILPYTHIDRAASKDASFPESRPVATRNRVWPTVLSQIKGEKILDVGCGFGRLTLDVAKQNPDSEVFGVDLFDSLTEQARMNAEVLGIKNVEFKTASAYDLPFEDGSFETVFSFFMLHHLDEILKGLNEIRRVLQKDGGFVAVEPIGHHHGPNYSGADWVRIIGEAGFRAETEERDWALMIRAQKSDEKTKK